MASYIFDVTTGGMIVLTDSGYAGAVQGPVVITTNIPTSGSPIIQVFKGSRLALSFRQSEVASVNGSPPAFLLLDLVIQLSAAFNTVA